jgi:hypothetical protein
MTKAPVNRVQQYIKTPTTKAPLVPYDDAVQHAVSTMCRLMESTDNQVAFNAANAVLEIEKTRLRHKMAVAGTDPVPQQQLQQQLQQPAPVEPARSQAAAKLAPGESEQFETAVDEFTVVMNRKKVKEGLPQYDPSEVRAAYELKLKDLGFTGLMKWHDWLMEMDNEPLPSASP